VPAAHTVISGSYAGGMVREFETEVQMADLVAVIASTHHPFYDSASTDTGEARPPFADDWVGGLTA